MAAATDSYLEQSFRNVKPVRAQLTAPDFQGFHHISIFFHFISQNLRK